MSSGGGQPFQFDLPPFPQIAFGLVAAFSCVQAACNAKASSGEGAARAESAAASHVHVLGSGNTIKTVPPVLRLGCVNVSVSPAHDLAEGSSLSVTAAS